MSLSKTIKHNQGLFTSALIALLIPLTIFGCHLTQDQKKQILSTTAIAAEAAAKGSPIPWSQIGLAFGTLFGSGVMIDNRRKDVLIKTLKKENATNHATINTILPTNDRHPPRVPPINTN
jgi:hypothetical protein